MLVVIWVIIVNTIIVPLRYSVLQIINLSLVLLTLITERNVVFV